MKIQLVLTKNKWTLTSIRMMDTQTGYVYNIRVIPNDISNTLKFMSDGIRAMIAYAGLQKSKDDQLYYSGTNSTNTVIHPYVTYTVEDVENMMDNLGINM